MDALVDSLSAGKIPEHVAIIMDGNRRWARAHGLANSAGHRAGAEAVETLIRFVAHSLPIRYLTLYAFSTENWTRSRREVDFLMTLFEDYLRDKVHEFIEEGICLKFLGDIERLPSSLQRIVRYSEESTREGSRLIVSVALNYGGREEIVQACRKLAASAVKDEIRVSEINEERIGAELYMGGMPDPALIIRTGGEMRLSNFLLWQAAYSEIYVAAVFWPDFSPERLIEALVEYQKRDRRFGGDGTASRE